MVVPVLERVEVVVVDEVGVEVSFQERRERFKLLCGRWIPGWEVWVVVVELRAWFRYLCG